MATETDLRDRADPQLTDDFAASQEKESRSQLEQPGVERQPIAIRTGGALIWSVLGAAVMIGGIFDGVSPRIYAAIAGLSGMCVGFIAARLDRPLRSSMVSFGGIFALGLVVIAPTGFGNIPDVRRLVAEAVQEGNVLRPPVPFLPGWHAILGWVMAIVGFQSIWLGIRMRRVMIALLSPLPVIAVAAISVPQYAQIGSGLAVLVLFVIGLGFASLTSLDTDVEAVPTGYRIRQVVRGLPVVAVITGLVYLLVQVDFLFPDPLVDPTQEPQKPKTVPISEAEDRVLFEVKSSVSGPWRIGSLDVYDGKDWRLPPFAEHQVQEVPESGILDPDVTPEVKAEFKIAGLQGAVLPTLPNTVRLVSRGPALAFDSRNDNIRVLESQVDAGQTYEVAAAGVPSVDELKRTNEPIPRQLRQFVRISDPPREVIDLIALAPKSSKWETFDFVRTWVLDNVTSTGTGAPKSVTPERVADMIAGTKQANPFEIVAAQAMLARWIGIPSRIGYGFDGGEQEGDTLKIRPAHGASFVEVYFPGFNWLPVIGTPKHAKATTTTAQQRLDPTVLPSEDIAVQLVFPVETPPPSVFARQVQRVVLVSAALLALIAAAYFAWPAIRKSVIRSRRRARARTEGTAARIAVAYADWRDVATDLGCDYPSDTPLMFLRRFPADEEHSELAWLVTRALWGDLRDKADSDLALYAEELSRSLRRRMSAAQPMAIRSVAMVSRNSLRHSYGNNGHG